MKKRGFQFLEKVVCLSQAVIPTIIMLNGILFSG
jgi:hypothetical protein